MPTTDYAGHYVFLDLSARSPITDRSDSTSMENFDTNRIALKCETVQISTSRDIMALPIPLSGIITEQQISKQFKAGDLEPEKVDTTVDLGVADRTYTDGEGKHVIVNMTAHEICQLIHSYVDSSFMQFHQNLNNLLVLIPSRVGKDWLYRSGLEVEMECL